MIRCVDTVKYNTLTFDTPWEPQKDVSIPLTTILKASYQRIFYRTPILNLLIGEKPPSAVVKKYLEMAKETDLTQAENIWAVKAALTSRTKKALATMHDVYSDRMRELLVYFGAKDSRMNSIVRRVIQLEKELIPQLDASVFVSQQDLDRYRELDVDLPNPRIVPNGVDTHVFRPLPRQTDCLRKYGIPEKPVILFAGSDMYQNRQAVDNAIKVFKKIGDNRYQLVVTGSVSSYAKQQARKHAVSIIALGHVEDMNEIYSIVDLVFIPLSTGTGTKLKVLEAMACGKPVITTTRGIRGLDVEKACVIADEEHEQIAQIRELLANPEKATELGREARKTALGFDWKRVMANYLDVYSRILG
jgi:glycosyltransferase involved in cell wall biosynthesis